MKKYVALASSLTLAITGSSYAQFVEIKSEPKPIKWEIEITSPQDQEVTLLSDEIQTEKITLNQYFAAGCALFGVHDEGLANPRFFCIHQRPNGKIRGRWFFDNVAPNADIEGLDYHDGHIFASSGDDSKYFPGKGAIWKSDPPSLINCEFDGIIVAEAATVDGIPMEEVDGITFDSNGNLWGWAQESGLFTVPSPPLDNLSNAFLVLHQPGEVEDLEFLNFKLYGALNIDHLGQVEDGDDEPHPNHPNSPKDVNAAVKEGGAVIPTLIQYDMLTGNNSVLCEQKVINKLNQEGFYAAEIEALEVLPRLPGVTDDYLLLGFHASPPPGKNPERSALVLGVLNLANCKLDLRNVRSVPGSSFKNLRMDIEGLAMVCPTN